MQVAAIRRRDAAGHGDREFRIVEAEIGARDEPEALAEPAAAAADLEHVAAEDRLALDPDSQGAGSDVAILDDEVRTEHLFGGLTLQIVIDDEAVAAAQMREAVLRRKILHPLLVPPIGLGGGG